MRIALSIFICILSAPAFGQMADTIILENIKANSVQNEVGFQHLYKRPYAFTSAAHATPAQSNRPLSFYMPTHHVSGLFCKMEYKIETTSKFAPRFRLGSVNYADWMEGKKPFMERYAR